MDKQKRKIENSDEGDHKAMKFPTEPKSETPHQRTSFKVIRKAFEKLSSDEILSFLTQICLENDCVMEKAMIKFENKREMKKIFVRSISYAATAEEFKKAMETIGRIEECKLVVDNNTRQCKGYGFVVFGDFRTAVKAVEMEKIEIGGRTAFMQFSVVTNEEKKSRRNGELMQQNNGIEKSENVIFVRNLNDKIDSLSLREAFAKFGKIEKCYIPRDRESGRQKNYGFVKFCNPQDAMIALEDPSKNINGVTVKCDYSDVSRRRSNFEEETHFNPSNFYNGPPPMNENLAVNSFQNDQNDLQRQLQDLQIAQVQLAHRIEAQKFAPNHSPNQNPQPYLYRDNPMNKDVLMRNQQ